MFKFVFSLVCAAVLFNLGLPHSALADTDGGGKSADGKPNIIFILTDDLGWGDLGVFYQNESKHDRKHKTPFLDKMAGEGLQMRAHYCPAPVCAPSRSSLLTGVHQGHAVIRDNQFDKALEANHTLGTVMQSAGYATVMVGKYGLQGLDAKDAKTWAGYPTKRGFDDFYGSVRHVDGHVHYPADNWPLGNSKPHRSKKQVWWNDKEVSADLQKCYSTDLFTAKSKQWIIDHRQSNPEQPFFLCLNYDTPHAALQVPTVAYPAGLGVDGGLQWVGKPGRMINTAEGEIDSFRHPDYTNLGWTDSEERFATMVRRIDHCVGDLLQTLKDLGIAENTLVVFTSDNGPHSNTYITKLKYKATSFQSYGPFDGTKRDTWEGGIRMPTLAWWPGKIPAGRIDSRPSQFHDWMATMADVGGITAPARCDGVSLVPTLTQHGEQAESTIYVEYEHKGNTFKFEDFLESRQKQKRGEMQVIHMDGYKGVRTNIKSHSDPFAIYDLTNDPGEENNLAGASEVFDKLQKEMHKRVLRLRIKNDSASRPYDDVAIPGYETLVGIAPGEIKQRNYHGDFLHVPNVATLEPVRETITRVVPEASPIQLATSLEKSGAIELEFVIPVKNPGKYTVHFSCPTKGFVRIHDAGVLDADFGYEANTNREATLNLGKGLHPVRVTVLTEESGDCSFEFGFTK